MNELRRLEEDEKIILDTQKMRNFHKEINNTYDKNLDDKLMEFVDKYDLEGSDIEYWVRRYNNSLKTTK